MVGTAQAGQTDAASVSLVNGDFETGDLTGWTQFTTTNGTMIAGVVPFDTDNDGVASSSAQFGVGQSSFEGFGVQRGGGIFQNVVLAAGTVSVTADIASDHPYAFCNLDGGTIRLLVDGAEVAAHSFGEICGPGSIHSRLNADVAIGTPGTHELRLLVTRGAMLSGVANYVDDIALSGSATVPASVANLIALVDSYELSRLGASLHEKLVAAQELVLAGNSSGACTRLNAFLAEVAAQSGKALTVEQANALTSGATQLEATLGC
jgi:hypothetical protein